MSKNSTSIFPELQIPDGIPANIATRLRSKDGALGLAAELAQKIEDVDSHAEERALKRQSDCARAVASYHALCDDFMRVAKAADDDRAAALRNIKAAQTDAAQAQEKHERITAEHRGVLSRIAALRQAIQEKTVVRDGRVDAAKEEFDRAMLSTDEALQQRCAEALHKAVSERKAAEDEAQPLILRLSGYQSVEERAADAVSQSQPHLEATQAEIQVAEFNLALVDADVRATEALIAFVQAQVALNRCTGARPPWGMDAVAFWVSTARRAVRTNNNLPRMGSDGPVLISGRPLQALVADARVPDLRVFNVSSDE